MLIYFNLLFVWLHFPKLKKERNNTHSNQNSAFLLLHVQHLLVTFGFYRSELTLTLVESTVKAGRESGEPLLYERSLVKMFKMSF